MTGTSQYLIDSDAFMTMHDGKRPVHQRQEQKQALPTIAGVRSINPFLPAFDIQSL
jgi:hypothetical protein